jgi:uncharacterized protein (TIGR02246 family)
MISRDAKIRRRALMSTNIVRRVLIVLALSSLCPGSALAQLPTDSTNRELASMAQADQQEALAIAKAGGSERDLRAWVSASAPRRELVRKLIRSGGLVTAEDYVNGALLLQHGDAPEDFLLAHVLATVAGFKGSRTGRFLSAVSLDRYLLNVGQPQAFGIQPMADFTKIATGRHSMSPNLATMSDQIRKEYAYPLTAAEIQKRVQAHNDSLSSHPPAQPHESTTSSPTKTEVARVVAEVSSTWNRHDMRAFAQLFAPDADFVNVGAVWWTGRAAIEKNHAFMHGIIDASDTVGVNNRPANYGIFRATTLTIDSFKIRMVTPEVAIARAAWNLRGDARTTAVRSGLFLFVLQRRDGGWQILTAQNTEANRPAALDK